MRVDVIQFSEIGLCRVDLVHVADNDAERWLVFFLSPRGPRIDTLSRVLRRAGGHFMNLDGQLGLAYEDPRAAHDAFGLLIDTIGLEAGAQRTTHSPLIEPGDPIRALN